MPTLAANNQIELYVPLASSMTFTPAAGFIEFGCSSPSGTDAPDGRKIYAASTITVPAGSKVFLRAVGGSATYTDPAGVDTALQALVSGDRSAFAPGQRKAGDGQLLWDFSTLTGYSASGGAGLGTISLVSSPTASAALGKPVANSIQFTVPAGGFSELNFPAIPAPQIPNQSIALVVEMLSGDTGAQAIAVLFLGTDGAYTNNVTRSEQLNQHGVVSIVPIQGAALQQWSPTGAPNWNGWTRGKLRVTAGTATVVVVVHAVLAAQSCPPTVCLIHDDNDVTAFTELRPRLDRYGFKAGFAVINDLVGSPPSTYMTWDQIDRLYKEGHDMIPHGQFNLNSYATAALAQADITKNLNALVDRGYTRGSEIYVYPNGNSEYSPTDRLSIRNHLRALGIKTAFRAGGTGFHPSGKGLGALDLARYPLNATINTTTFFNTLDAGLESARAFCGMIHVILPSGATGSDINRADIDTVLAGLATRQAAGTLRVVSPTEQLALMGIA